MYNEPEVTRRTPDHPTQTVIPLSDPCLLFLSKTGLVTTAWDRLFFFTQGGNLMCQPRGAVAGGMVLDLDNSSVMAVDCEDRRYCFQITSPSGKTYVQSFDTCETFWKFWFTPSTPPSLHPGQ